MAITLAQLCYNCDKIYDMKLMAGSGGLTNFIRWVHMVEDVEVPDFLHGNELIFTTGIGQQKDHDTDWIIGFVEKMNAKKAAGLVINIGPYISNVPQAVIDYCERNQLPLFIVPWRVHLIDMTYDFCHRIIANEETELGLASAFRNLIFSPENTKGYSSALERKGFHDDGSYCICSLKLTAENGTPSGKDYLSIKFLLQKIFTRESRQCVIFTQDESLIVVFQGVAAEYIEEKLTLALHEHEGEFLPCHLMIGISSCGFGYSCIPGLFAESTAALKVAIIRNSSVMQYNSIGAYRLLLSVPSCDTIRAFKADVLGPLEEFDSQNNSNYTRILREYLESDSSIQIVAIKNKVHRNTINYQVKKIKEILGCSFTYEEKAELILAYYIKDLLEA